MRFDKPALRIELVLVAVNEVGALLRDGSDDLEQGVRGQFVIMVEQRDILAFGHCQGRVGSGSDVAVAGRRRTFTWGWSSAAMNCTVAGSLLQSSTRHNSQFPYHCADSDSSARDKYSGGVLYAGISTDISGREVSPASMARSALVGAGTV